MPVPVTDTMPAHSQLIEEAVSQAIINVNQRVAELCHKKMEEELMAIEAMPMEVEHTHDESRRSD